MNVEMITNHETTVPALPRVANPVHLLAGWLFAPLGLLLLYLMFRIASEYFELMRTLESGPGMLFT